MGASSTVHRESRLAVTGSHLSLGRLQRRGGGNREESILVWRQDILSEPKEVISKAVISKAGEESTAEKVEGEKQAQQRSPAAKECRGNDIA